MAITTLTALVPKEFKAFIRIVDQNTGQRVPYFDEWDIVGISITTNTAPIGYQIADRFKSKNVPVILGGIHVSLVPNEAAMHADTVVLGAADRTWPQLLRDFAAGKLKKRYTDLDNTIIQQQVPRWDFKKKRQFKIPNTIQVTQGCPKYGDYSNTLISSLKIRKRPIGTIIDEIGNLKGRRLVIVDEHITDDTEYAKELFQALIPFNKKWSGFVPAMVAGDTELITLMKRSGCSHLFTIMDPFENISPNTNDKEMSAPNRYYRLTEILHHHDIYLHGCITLGCDNHSSDIFEMAIDYVNDLKIDMPHYAVLTPFPHTSLFKRLEKENRILHSHWQYYDTQHVVIHPQQMTPLELDKGLRYVYKKTYKTIPCLGRSLTCGRNIIKSFTGSLLQVNNGKNIRRKGMRFPESIPVSHLHRTAEHVKKRKERNNYHGI